MNKAQRKQMLTIAAGVVAAGALVGATAAHLIAHGMMKIALEREIPHVIPQSKKKISGAAKTDPFLEAIKETGEQLAQIEMEQVEIEAQDGIHLVGHWYPCPGARRVIVAMHGWRSTWTNDFGMITDFWHNNGCHILFAEQRGQNNSGGDYMTFGYLERHDCLEWAKWATERTEGALPLYLCGVSMGASTVLMTAGLTLPSSVHGIMADCGFTSAYEIWRHVAEKNLHLSYRIHGSMIEKICQKTINASSRDISTLSALPQAKVPILFIHGTSDTFVPIQMTYDNYLACASPKRLLVVPGAGHGQSYYLERARYEQAALDFWASYDERIPQPAPEQEESTEPTIQ